MLFFIWIADSSGLTLEFQTIKIRSEAVLGNSFENGKYSESLRVLYNRFYALCEDPIVTYDFQ